MEVVADPRDHEVRLAQDPRDDGRADQQQDGRDDHQHDRDGTRAVEELLWGHQAGFDEPLDGLVDGVAGHLADELEGGGEDSREHQQLRSGDGREHDVAQGDATDLTADRVVEHHRLVGATGPPGTFGRNVGDAVAGLRCRRRCRVRPLTNGRQRPRPAGAHALAQCLRVRLRQHPEFDLHLAAAAGGLDTQRREPEQALHGATVEFDLLDPADVERTVVAAEHPLVDPDHLAVEREREPLPREQPVAERHQAEDEQQPEGQGPSGRDAGDDREQQGLEQLSQVDAEHHRGGMQPLRGGEPAGVGRTGRCGPSGNGDGGRIRRHRRPRPGARGRPRRRGSAARHGRPGRRPPGCRAARRCRWPTRS
jgi:hypothetical protein